MLNKKHQATALSVNELQSGFIPVVGHAVSVSLEGRCFRRELKCDGDVDIRLQAAVVLTNVSAAESVDYLIRAVLIVRAEVDIIVDQIHLKPAVRPGTEPVRSLYSKSDCCKSQK